MTKSSVKATLTSKGQFTIPKEIRRKLGLKPGMKVDVVLQGPNFLVRPRRILKIQRLAGILQDLDDGRPTDEIIRETQRLAAREIIKRDRR